MKNKALITVLALFASGVLRAEIREVRSMREVVSYVTPQTLLVFDLDNTVVEPEQTLGSDQWFEFMVQGFEKSGTPKDLAVQKALIFWNEIAHHTKIRPVEKITPLIIRQAQQAGITVLGLTARHIASAGETERQLQSIGVDFKARPIYAGVLAPSTSEGPYLRNGIMYSGPLLSKGAALVGLLKQLKLTPARVVFVDDKAKHTQTVDAALNEAKIQNFEFRYGAADPRVAVFDSRVANVQLAAFLRSGSMLSDEQARRSLSVR